MFDYIKCEHLFPDGLDRSGWEFQTKGYEDRSDLRRLVINPGGRLYEVKALSDDECSRISGTEFIAFSFWSGNLHFYGSPPGEKKPCTHGYTASFKDGNLIGLEMSK